MTPEQVIEILKVKKECWDYEGFSCEIGSCLPEETTCAACEVAIETAIEIIERQQWIPCSERLPENIKTVLVTIKESEQPMLGWYGNKFGWRIVAAEFANIKDFTVIAWMPLPPAYKEGE